jgi:hypothetical protein
MASQFVQLPVVGGGGIDWSTPVDANIVPDANFAYDLGASATAEFYHVWANKLSTGFANGNIDLEAFDGRIQLYAASANGGEVSVYDISNVAAIPLRLYANNQSDFVGFVAPATTTSNVTYVLPSADGTSGQVLSTNGSGILSWATAGGSVDWANVNSDINFDTAFGYQIGNNRPPFNIYSGIFSATDSSFYQQLEVLAQDSPSGEHPNLPNLRAIIRSTYGSDIGIITTQDSITNTGDSSNFGVITGNVTTGTDNTGGLFLRSGNSTGGNSGSIELIVGTAGSTRGDVVLDANSVVTKTSIVPDANNQYTLGASGFQFIEGYIRTVYGDGGNLDFTGPVTLTGLGNDVVLDSTTFVQLNGPRISMNHNTGDQIGEFDLSGSLVSTSWGSNIPSYIIDGTSTAATNIGAAGFVFKGDDTAWFTILTEDQTTANSAPIYFGTGNSSSGDSGHFELYTGSATSAGTTGYVRLESGSNGNLTGEVIFKSGNTVLNNATTGDVALFTGNATGTAANSGNIEIITGTATGTRGLLRLDASVVETMTNIVPDVDATRNLGSVSTMFSNVYANQLTSANPVIFALTGGVTLQTLTPQDINFDANGGRTVVVNGVLKVWENNGTPGGVQAGEIFFDTSVNKLMVFNGVTWETIQSV